MEREHYRVLAERPDGKRARQGFGGETLWKKSTTGFWWRDLMEREHYKVLVERPDGKRALQGFGGET